MTLALPPENLYGHTKKLRYLLAQIRAEQTRLGRPLRVLDFGCGNGSAVSQYIIDLGVDYTGVDFHEPSLEYARARYAGEHARFLPQAPGDGPYDVLVYSDVLEHLHDPAQVLREHRPLLGDGGVLIGSVPNGYGPFEMEKRIGHYTGTGFILTRLHRVLRKAKHKVRGSGEAGQTLPYNAENGHVQFYTRKSLTHTLGRGGYGVDRFAKGCFLGSSLTAILLRGGTIMRINNALGDVLPAWAVSTWYFTARPTAEQTQEPGL